MLYDVARGVLIHRPTADGQMKAGATYLVVSRKGAEGAVLAHMVETWAGEIKGKKAKLALAPLAPMPAPPPYR